MDQIWTPCQVSCSTDVQQKYNMSHIFNFNFSSSHIKNSKKKYKFNFYNMF